MTDIDEIRQEQVKANELEINYYRDEIKYFRARYYEHIHNKAFEAADYCFDLIEFYNRIIKEIDADNDELKRRLARAMSDSTLAA